jgi:predicted alpha/beta-hydrolase family hydrolase
MGKGEARDTSHLTAIDAPQLFFAGTRDRLGPPQMIARIAESAPDGYLVVVDDGDHSFNVPKRAGRTRDEVLASIVADTSSWLDSLRSRSANQ